MIQGARQLPLHHLSIRVPWHDSAWNGTVCKKPRDNASCLALSRIGDARDDVVELRVAGKRWDELAETELPVCKAERASFMAPFDLTRMMRHPYAEWSELHRHFSDTPFRTPAYSAACVPFRWMVRKNAAGDAETKIRGIAEELQLDFDVSREPELPFETAWTQERTNQLVMLDTFFSAVRPEESLCFFYAKRTPLSEDSRRVIVGVGRALSVGEATEYRYSVKSPPLRCALWERNVAHSIRPGFQDGFLFPYHDLLELAAKDSSVRPEDFVAFAPEDHWQEFSYASEHVTHDGAIAALLASASALKRLSTVLPGRFDAQIAWIDKQLQRMWQMRGPFPGMGAALRAFGLERGNLVAYEIAAAQARAGTEWNEDPWPLFDQVVEDPTVLGNEVASEIGKTFRSAWKKLPAERRALLKLLARFTLNDDQAKRFFDPATREGEIGADLTDAGLLANPYRIYEDDRGSADPVQAATIDRGLFPDPVVREKHPVPAPSALDDAIDPRRVRALVIDDLEQAAAAGHTLKPRSWVARGVAERELQPPCPLSEDVLAVTEDGFPPLVATVEVAGGGRAFQLERLVETRTLIQSTIHKRIAGKRHAVSQDWRKLVDRELSGEAAPKGEAERDIEERARREKATALEEIHASRFSVLIGPAGTGKTTLLRALCGIEDVKRGGVLLLAPTGKARVRLEQQTKQSGALTIAQFLNRLGRYDASTGAYLVTGSTTRRSADHKTVIIDECSMLTEEQLAAVLDAVTGVERLVLVGDPRQLPPIGSGRPFVDIVRHLEPENVESIFPKRARGYAELTIPRRQVGASRDDLVLAQWFSGRPCDAGADEIWDRLEKAAASDHLRLEQWTTPDDLEGKLTEALVRELGLSGPDDENKFEESLGGSPYGDKGTTFFWAGKDRTAGACAKAEAWQLLSPVRAGQHGVDALNRSIQERFRKRALDWAQPKDPRFRRVSKPFGAQGIVYGDKVINIVNGQRRDVWPRPDDLPYVANGDIGMVVGEYKRKTAKHMPWKLEVEFVAHPGLAIKFYPREFGDEGQPPLELAYALTVHKTQGSEFGKTFVILPNPCWLLSRELLYTALTRQRDRVVIFHQGPLRDFRKYSSALYSDIGQRMTNLFTAPRPREMEVEAAKRFFEEGLIHRTERGEAVRSKSELVIADKLHARGIDYVYEGTLRFADGSERYPDFTIHDDDAGVHWYWEHLGMMTDPAYRARWERKLAGYREVGVLPREEGGGPNGTLVTSMDDENGGLDGGAIARIIDEIAGKSSG